MNNVDPSDLARNRMLDALKYPGTVSKIIDDQAAALKSIKHAQNQCATIAKQFASTDAIGQFKSARDAIDEHAAALKALKDALSMSDITARQVATIEANRNPRAVCDFIAEKNAARDAFKSAQSWSNMITGQSAAFKSVKLPNPVGDFIAEQNAAKEAVKSAQSWSNMITGQSAAFQAMKQPNPIRDLIAEQDTTMKSMKAQGFMREILAQLYFETQSQPKLELPSEQLLPAKLSDQETKTKNSPFGRFQYFLSSTLALAKHIHLKLIQAEKLSLQTPQFIDIWLTELRFWHCDIQNGLDQINNKTPRSSVEYVGSTYTKTWWRILLMENKLSEIDSDLDSILSRMDN